MIALDAVASSTSDSLMAPAPVWMVRILTRSSLSLISESASTSADPCTSALMMIGSSFMPPSAICCCSDSSVRRAPLPNSSFSLACAWRYVTTWRALIGSSMTWNVSPGDGSADRPSTSTGVDGPAFLIFCAEVIEQRADLAVDGAGDEQVALADRAVLDQDVRDGTAAAVELGFDDRALRHALRVGLEVARYRRRAGSSRAAGRVFLRWRADTSTVTVVPPHASGIRPSSDSSRLTRSALAPGLSILLTATTIGTLAAFAWSIASRVCGMTPSSAATTRTTMSVTLAPRARIIVNAS